MNRALTDVTELFINITSKYCKYCWSENKTNWCIVLFFIPCIFWDWHDTFFDQKQMANFLLPWLLGSQKPFSICYLVPFDIFSSNNDFLGALFWHAVIFTVDLLHIVKGFWNDLAQMLTKMRRWVTCKKLMVTVKVILWHQS